MQSPPPAERWSRRGDVTIHGGDGDDSIEGGAGLG